MLSMRTRVSAVARTDAVFKAYDIRGTYPDQIDGTLIRALGAAVAKHCAVPTLLVARDMRASGVELTAAFAEGAATQGVGIIDLGMASTDFLYFAAGHLNAPGAMFTASHNPAQYNGVKLCYAGARPIGQDTGLAEIQALTEGFLASPPPPAVPDVTERDLLGEWVKHVHSFIDVGALRPLKIIADTANGMGGLVVPLVMAGLPFEVEILYPELDGTFPNHPADPIQPENLVALQQAVLERGADIGLAFDGDADRVFLVDEHAEGVSGSLTTAMVADAMLTKHPGATILYNLICSKVVPEVVEAQGGTAVKTRVGHSFISGRVPSLVENTQVTTTTETTSMRTRGSSRQWWCSNSWVRPESRCPNSLCPMPATAHQARSIPRCRVLQLRWLPLRHTSKERTPFLIISTGSPQRMTTGGSTSGPQIPNRCSV